MAVHLTRPKSSKGRRRSTKTLNNFFQNNTDSDPQLSGHGSGVSAEFVVGGQDTQLRPQFRPEMRHSRVLSQDQVQQKLLSESAAGGAGGQSLNKYKVLPSIEKGGRPKSSHLCVGKELHNLTLTGSRPVLKPTERCDDTKLTAGRELGTCSSDYDRKLAPSSNTLLLAIKDPDGRRFQQHFNPSDTLLRVRASAEATYGVKFGENATIETMEVPRRSFTDMSLTLVQCGISDKSVLCIFQPQDE